MCTEPSKEVLGRRFGDKAAKKNPGVSGVAGKEALAMRMQHDRRDRGSRWHQRSRRIQREGHDGREGRGRPLIRGRKACKDHGRSKAEELKT